MGILRDVTSAVGKLERQLQETGPKDDGFSDDRRKRNSKPQSQFLKDVVRQSFRFNGVLVRVFYDRNQAFRGLPGSMTYKHAYAEIGSQRFERIGRITLHESQSVDFNPDCGCCREVTWNAGDIECTAICCSSAGDAYAFCQAIGIRSEGDLEELRDKIIAKLEKITDKCDGF